MKEEVDYSLKLVKDAEASQMTDVSSTDTGALKGKLSFFSNWRFGNPYLTHEWSHSSITTFAPICFV